MRTIEGSRPISARLYRGLQTHGIHSKGYAIMDRAWNSFTHSILSTQVIRDKTKSQPIRIDTSFFFFFHHFLRGMIEPLHRPFLFFSRFSFSKWLESQECRIFLPLYYSQNHPFLFVQRNSSQCLPTIFVGFIDNYGVSWDLMKRNLFLACKLEKFVPWILNHFFFKY